MSTMTLTPSITLPARVAGPAPRSRTMRLTRRGRLVVTCLVVTGLVLGLIVLAGSGWGGGAASASGAGGGPVEATRVTVQPGETLWAIAERCAPAADPRETILAIMDLNAMSSAGVRAGQVLLVPRADVD